MTWLKTAAICLCIIGGFAAQIYMDRYAYWQNNNGGAIHRIDKWTGQHSSYLLGWREHPLSP